LFDDVHRRAERLRGWQIYCALHNNVFFILFYIDKLE